MGGQIVDEVFQVRFCGVLNTFHERWLLTAAAGDDRPMLLRLAAPGSHRRTGGGKYALECFSVANIKKKEEEFEQFKVVLYTTVTSVILTSA